MDCPTDLAVIGAATADHSGGIHGAAAAAAGAAVAFSERRLSAVVRRHGRQWGRRLAALSAAASPATASPATAPPVQIHLPGRCWRIRLE